MSSCKICHKSSKSRTAATFFRFPRNAERCKLWAEKCNLMYEFERLGYEYFNKTFRLCHEHFASSMIQWKGKKKALTLDAVPELLLNFPLKVKITAPPVVNNNTEKEIDDMLQCDDAEFRLQMVDHVCRFCHEEKANLISVFGQYGKSLGLPIKIKYAPVKISENDIVPAKICRRCIQEVEASFKFITRCLESDKKIRIILDMEDKDTTYEVERKSKDISAGTGSKRT